MKNSKVFLSLKVAVAGFGLFSSLLLLPLSVSAKPNVDKVVTNDSSQRGPTKEEMKNSKPFVNPLPTPDTSSVQPLGGDFPVELPEAAPGAVESQGFANLQAYGEFGVPFTSKRVTHDPPPKDVKVTANAGAYLSATYPYSAVGKLYFKEKDGWTHCSASLILRSVIVTAAHCIQKFGGRIGYLQQLDICAGLFQQKYARVPACHALWELGLERVCETGFLGGRNRYSSGGAYQ